MIPKTIHYCWMSKDPYPDKIVKCMESWKKYLPDYEFKLWNYDTFPRGESQWVDEAFDSKKYAFAADYIRCYSLYHEGGIYLDSDVEVIKSFNHLLDLPYILGKENTSGNIEAAVMGSKVGNEVFKVMLDYYDSHHFLHDDGSLDIEPMPGVMRRCIENHGMDIVEVGSEQDFDCSEGVVSILPVDYFSPKSFTTDIITTTPNTVCIHHYADSWMDKTTLCLHGLKKALARTFGLDVVNKASTPLLSIYKLFTRK